MREVKLDMPSNGLSITWLSHELLVIAGILVWNLLSLGYLIFDRPHILNRGPWWELITLGAFFFILALFGLFKSLVAVKNNVSKVEYNPNIRWLLLLGTGLSTFLLGWLPCLYIMGKLMQFGYVCDTGAIAAMVVVWLPVGVVVSVITVIISWKITKKSATQ